MTMDALSSTLTRWRVQGTDELLVAIALKDDEGVRSVLPVRQGKVPHPFDWLPEESFLRIYEQA